MIRFNLVIELNKFDPKTEKTIFLNWILGQFLKYIMEENLFWVQREKRFECKKISTQRKYL